MSLLIDDLSVGSPLPALACALAGFFVGATQMQPVNPARVALLRKASVLSATGKSNSGLYADIARDIMVQPVRIGPRAVAWPSDEVDAVVSARIAGASEDQLRSLVRRLHERRKAAGDALLQGA